MGGNNASLPGRFEAPVQYCSASLWHMLCSDAHGLVRHAAVCTLQGNPETSSRLYSSFLSSPFQHIRTSSAKHVRERQATPCCHLWPSMIIKGYLISPAEIPNLSRAC